MKISLFWETKVISDIWDQVEAHKDSKYFGIWWSDEYLILNEWERLRREYII